MTDGAYDIVLIDADKEGYPGYVEEAARLLRSGGVMVLDNMLWHDKVADPAARDDTTKVLRDLGKSIRATSGSSRRCSPPATGCSSRSSADPAGAARPPRRPPDGSGQRNAPGPSRPGASSG